MENTAYGSTPALVVFSQAANGLGETLRIQRPFHSQLPDAKDLHHLSLVGSYGAHLLHGFPPHFLHPSVTSSGVNNTGHNAFSSGTGAFVKPFPSLHQQHQQQQQQQHQFQHTHNANIPLRHHTPHNSAFAPPKSSTIAGTIDQNIVFSGSESFRTDSSSPVCASLSPPVKEESQEAHTSDDGDRDIVCSPDRSNDDSGFRPPKPGNEPLNLRMDSGNSMYRFPFYNTFKNFHTHQAGFPIKKLAINTPPSNMCPVCGVQLAAHELESHFHTELDRLYKLSAGGARGSQQMRNSNNFNISTIMNPQNMCNNTVNHLPTNPQNSNDNRWEVFQRIRNNRQSRLRAKTRKRKCDSESDFAEQQHQQQSLRSAAQCQSCPVCHGRLQRTAEEIAQHVDECIRKQNIASGRLPPPSMQTTSSAHDAGAGEDDDDEETVDVESYGDETPPGLLMNTHHVSHILAQPSYSTRTESNAHISVNIAQMLNNNNQNMKIDVAQQSSLDVAHSERVISSVSASWDGKSHTNNNRISAASPSIVHSVYQSAEIDAVQHSSTGAHINVARATPTSSDQKSGREEQRSGGHNADSGKMVDMNVTGERGSADRDSIVDLDSDDKMNSDQRATAEEKYRPEEATSSMEIDSFSETTAAKHVVPTAESYVSTTEQTEPSSRAQVLEELRARIRELEGSPFNVRRNSQDEDHYKCYICKESYTMPDISTKCWHVHCNTCWIPISDNQKSCPRCHVITTVNELRTINK